MIVLKFGSSLFNIEDNLRRIKSVIESIDDDAIIVVPKEHVKPLVEITPNLRKVTPGECLAGHREALLPHGGKLIVPGIIPDGFAASELTDLEVGAPDYLASLIAASNDAQRLEIWTDMEGFMTADSSSGKTACLIKGMR